MAMPAARPLPTRTTRARSVTRRTNSSATLSMTTARLVAVQRWPLQPHAPRPHPRGPRGQPQAALVQPHDKLPAPHPAPHLEQAPRTGRVDLRAHFVRAREGDAAHFVGADERFAYRTAAAVHEIHHTLGHAGF